VRRTLRRALIVAAVLGPWIWILPAVYAPASHVAVGWAAINLGGLYFSLRNLREARRDLAALNALDLNGDAREMAVVSVRSEVIRAAELAAGALVGIIASTSLAGSFLEHALIVLLFAVPVGITANTIVSSLYREEFTDAHRIRRRGEKGEPHGKAR
jgi:hypothetical protein